MACTLFIASCRCERAYFTRRMLGADGVHALRLQLRCYEECFSLLELRTIGLITYEQSYEAKRYISRIIHPARRL
jgi:hypothetical protein